jgi:hypothetical protein
MLGTNKLFNHCLLKVGRYCSCSSSSSPRWQQLSGTGKRKMVVGRAGFEAVRSIMSTTACCLPGLA